MKERAIFVCVQCNEIMDKCEDDSCYVVCPICKSKVRKLFAPVKVVLIEDDEEEEFNGFGIA
jgi:predicted nucleic acid-binding Zn ribbon protein